MARINMTKGFHCGEYPRRGYLLGLFTPIAWDNGNCPDFGELVEQRVVLTGIPIDPPGLGECTHNDAYQAECACDCACA